MAEFAKVRKIVRDIQVFEFNESAVDSKVHSIPWCPYILVVVDAMGHSIIDLRKPDPTVSSRREALSRWGLILLSINTHSKAINLNLPYLGMLIDFIQKGKQLVITQKPNYDKFRDRKSKIAPTNQLLFIYNIDNDGKVDRAKQIDTKKQDCSSAILLSGN